MKKIRILFAGVLFFTLVLASSLLNGEIQRITIKWLPGLCLEPCVRDVTRNLLGINGAAELLMSPNQAQADIRWRPRAPFSVGFVNNAMSLAGPSIQEIRVKVRGTISHSANAILLTSLGDNTQFLLLSPLRVNVNQNTPTDNIELYRLAPAVAQSFLDAEADNAVVTVEGPLFDPISTMGLYLIVEQATFDKFGKGAIPIRH